MDRVLLGGQSWRTELPAVLHRKASLRPFSTGEKKTYRHKLARWNAIAHQVDGGVHSGEKPAPVESTSRLGSLKSICASRFGMSLGCSGPRSETRRVIVALF